MQYAQPTLEKRGDKYFLIFSDGEIELTEAELKQHKERLEGMKQYLETGARYAEQNVWTVADVPKEFDSIVRVDMFIQNLTKALEQFYQEGDEPERLEWMIGQLISGTNKDLYNPLLKRNEVVNQYLLESLKGVQELFKALQTNSNTNHHFKPLSKTMRNTLTDFFLVMRQEEHVITDADIEQFLPEYPEFKVGDVYSPTMVDTAKCTEADFNLLYQRHWRAYAEEFEYAIESTFLDRETNKAENLFTVLNVRKEGDYWARQYLELCKSYWHWLKGNHTNPHGSTKQQPSVKRKLTATAISLFCAMAADSGIEPRVGLSAAAYCLQVCEAYQLRYGDRVRQLFTVAPTFKKGNKDLQKVVEHILPSLTQEKKTIIEKYIAQKIEPLTKKMYE